MRHKFEKIAFNSTAKKKPIAADKDTYLGLEHLDSDSLTVTRFGSEVAPIGEKLLMQKGDVLFGKRRAYQKKVAIAPFDGIFSAHGMVLRPKTDIVTERFFPLFVASDYFLDAAIKISVGSLSPTINWSALRELEFNLPSLDEQNSLAEVLWAMIEAKNAYKRLLLLTDDLVKSQFVEMFGLPASNIHGWDNAKIRDVVTSVRYGTSKPSTGDGQYVYLRMNNITYDGQLDLTDTKLIDIPDSELDKCAVQRGDLLFNRTNSRELVGKTCVYNMNEPMIIAGYIIRVRFKDNVLPQYISAFLNSNYGKKLLSSMCKGAIGQANINAQEFQDIDILVPPLALQNRFADFVQQADKSKFVARKATQTVKESAIMMMASLFGAQTHWNYYGQEERQDV